MDEIWFQIGPGSGPWSTKYSAKWSKPLIQNGPHTDCFWPILYHPKRVHARTGLKTFVFHYTFDPKSEHLSDRQAVPILFGESCLQNGLHFLLRLACTCHSRWLFLRLKAGRQSASRWTASLLSAADRLSTSSAKARPRQQLVPFGMVGRAVAQPLLEGSVPNDIKSGSQSMRDIDLFR